MAGVRPLRTSWLIVGNENLALNRCRLSLGQRSAARGLHPVAKRATPRRGGPLDCDGGCPDGHTRRRPASGTPNAEYTVAHARVSTERRAPSGSFAGASRDHPGGPVDRVFGPPRGPSAAPRGPSTPCAARISSGPTKAAAHPFTSGMCAHDDTSANEGRVRRSFGP